MKLLSLNEVEEFMILAKNVYDNTGKVLLKKETVLTNYYLDRLRNFGIDSLYVIDGLTCDSMIEERDRKDEAGATAPVEPQVVTEPVDEEKLTIELPPEIHLLKENEIQEAAKGDTLLEALKATSDILDNLVGKLQPFDLEAVRSELPFMTTDMSSFTYEKAQPGLSEMGAAPGLADSAGMEGAGIAPGIASGIPGPDFLTTGAIAEQTPLQNEGKIPDYLRFPLEPTSVVTAAIQNGMNTGAPGGYFREIPVETQLEPTSQQVGAPTMGEGYAKSVAPEGMNSSNRNTFREIPTANSSGPTSGQVETGPGAQENYFGAAVPEGPDSGNCLDPNTFITGAIRNSTNPEAPADNQEDIPCWTPSGPIINPGPPQTNTGEGDTQPVSPGVVVSNSENRLEPNAFITSAILNSTNSEASTGNQEDIPSWTPSGPNINPVGLQTNTGERDTQTVSPGMGVSNLENRLEPNIFTTKATRNPTNFKEPSGFQPDGYQQEISTQPPSGSIINPVQPETDFSQGYLKTIAPETASEEMNSRQFGPELSPVQRPIEALISEGSAGSIPPPQNPALISPVQGGTPPEGWPLTAQTLKKDLESPDLSTVREVQSNVTLVPVSAPEKNDRNQIGDQTLHCASAQITNSILENLMGKIDIQKLTLERTRAGIDKITDTIFANLPGQIINEEFRDEIKFEVYQISKDAMSGIQEELIRSETIRKTVYSLLMQLILNERILHLIVNLRTYNEALFVHSVSVSVLAMMIGMGAGFSPEILNDLGTAGLLHDIGKVFVPKELLEKKGDLTGEEKREIQKHPIYGYEFLQKFNDLPPIAAVVALRHHEFLDGSGYPYHLKKNEINHYARVITLADAYDALINDDRYRNLPYEIIEYIRDMSHSIFDRELTRVFLQNIHPFPVGSMVLLNNGEKAIISKLSKDLPARPFVRVITNQAGELKKKPVEYNLEEDLTLFVIQVLSA